MRLIILWLHLLYVYLCVCTCMCMCVQMHTLTEDYFLGVSSGLPSHWGRPLLFPLLCGELGANLRASVWLSSPPLILSGCWDSDAGHCIQLFNGFQGSKSCCWTCAKSTLRPLGHLTTSKEWVFSVLLFCLLRRFSNTLIPWVTSHGRRRLSHENERMGISGVCSSHDHLANSLIFYSQNTHLKRPKTSGDLYIYISEAPSACYKRSY